MTVSKPGGTQQLSAVGRPGLPRFLSISCRTGRADHRIAFDFGGLDYPGVGPEHAYLKDIGRTEYRPITDVGRWTRFGCCAAWKGSFPNRIRARGRGCHQVRAGVGCRIGDRGEPVRARGQDVETAAKWFGMLDEGQASS